MTAASVAVTNPELFASWLVSYGREKITLSADVSDPVSLKIAFRGWQKKTEVHLYDHLQFFNDRGLKYAKSTDVTRDGVMEGPNFDFYQAITRKFPDLKILASGGIRGIDDIKRFQELGLFAVIFGKAFYEGILKLKELEKFISENGS